MERIETEKKVGSCYSLLLAFSLQWRRSRSRRAKSCGGGRGGGEKPALQATSCYAFNGMLSGYQWNPTGVLLWFALHTCVYIYIRRLSSFRAPMLWFIDLTVASCHIQYTFLSLCQYCFHKKTDKTWKYSSPPFSYDTKMAADDY